AYLAACLAAMLVGLYPQAVYPSRTDVPAAPLPALQSLAAAQALFIVLVHPLIILRRTQRGEIARYWTETIVESLTWLVATIPLYAASAWLADATPGDVVRTVVYLLCLWPLAWSAGSVLRTWPAARPVVVLLLLVVAALPAGHYITREFLRVFPSDWLWDLAPATFAWQAARSRADALLPTPLWALAIWPVVAGAVIAVRLLRGTNTVNG
ncbi:MAG: hypothetical protein WBF17_01955, partial [Phycisphaerae bacterium]